MERAKKIMSVLFGALILLALSSGLAWVVARFLSHVISFGGTIQEGIITGSMSFVDSALAAPLDITWSDYRVFIPAVIVFVIPLLFAMFSLSRGMKLKKEETGAEHGKDRFATEREASALVDKKVKCNNIPLTENCGLAIHSYDRRTKKLTAGRNINTVTIGISGLGKTFNGVFPTCLAAVGDALDAHPYGIRNIPTHIKSRKEDPIEVVPESAQLDKDETEAQSSRASAKALGGSGFDVVLTDPKGDVVRDCGGMFEAAGFDVKVYDTITFDALRFNPLAYIKTVYSDVKKPEQLECRVREHGSKSDILRFGGKAPKEDGPNIYNDDDDTAHKKTKSTPSPYKLRATFNYVVEEEKTLKYNGKTVAEIDAELKVATGVRREELLEQRSMAQMHEEMKGTHAEGHSTPASVLSSSARRTHTTGQIELTITNTSPEPAAYTFDLLLDPAISVKAIDPPDNVSIKWDKDCRIATITIDELEGKKDFKPALGSVSVLLIFETARRRSAEGVSLARVVNCLVTTLRGTDAKSNHSEDPFWDDCKRLCFMSLISFLFERYEEKYRTLPEMIRLLNLAGDDDGGYGDIWGSPLGQLMMSWEYGVMNRAAGSHSSSSFLGKHRASGYEQTGDIPHPREESLAVGCFHAFMEGAEDTVRSIIITCKAALVNLLSVEVRGAFDTDELHLETLGDPNQKQVLFVVTSDTESPYDFLTSLLVFIGIDILLQKAFTDYGGKLPRHVRFVLDEVANLGKLTVLPRAMAVVRSRNISIALYIQSKSQLKSVYGEYDADTIINNCTAMLYLGSQDKESREEMSERIGEETVNSRYFQRSFGNSSVESGVTESIQSTARRVMSASEVARMSDGKMLCFVFRMRAVYENKFRTERHPLYCWICPDDERGLLQAPAKLHSRFDFGEYRARRAALDAATAHKHNKPHQSPGVPTPEEDAKRVRKSARARRK